jgi:hypothetical protein
MLPQTGSPPMEQNANRELEHIDWIQLQAALGQQLARHQVTPAFPSDTHTYSWMTFRKCVYFPPDRSLRGDRVSKCQNFTPAWRSIRFLLASTIFLSTCLQNRDVSCLFMITTRKTVRDFERLVYDRSRIFCRS